MQYRLKTDPTKTCAIVEWDEVVSYITAGHEVAQQLPRSEFEALWERVPEPVKGSKRVWTVSSRDGFHADVTIDGVPICPAIIGWHDGLRDWWADMPDHILDAVRDEARRRNDEIQERQREVVANDSGFWTQREESKEDEDAVNGWESFRTGEPKHDDAKEEGDQSA